MITSLPKQIFISMLQKYFIGLAISIFSLAENVQAANDTNPIHINPSWGKNKQTGRTKDLNAIACELINSKSIHIFATESANLEYAITTPKGYILKSGPLEQYQDEVVSIEDLPKGRYVLYIYSEDEIWYGYFTK